MHCEYCGKYKEQMASSTGLPLMGCSDLACIGVHPYFVARAILTTNERIAELASRIEALRVRFMEAGDGK